MNHYKTRMTMYIKEDNLKCVFDGFFLSVFNRSIFLKVLLEELTIKCFFKRHYKWFFINLKVFLKFY